jgi:hypothetical protein
LIEQQIKLTCQLAETQINPAVFDLFRTPEVKFEAAELKNDQKTYCTGTEENESITYYVPTKQQLNDQKKNLKKLFKKIKDQKDIKTSKEAFKSITCKVESIFWDYLSNWVFGIFIIGVVILFAFLFSVKDEQLPEQKDNDLSFDKIFLKSDTNNRKKSTAYSKKKKKRKTSSRSKRNKSFDADSSDDCKIRVSLSKKKKKRSSSRPKRNKFVDVDLSDDHKKIVEVSKKKKRRRRSAKPKQNKSFDTVLSDDIKTDNEKVDTDSSHDSNTDDFDI